MDIALNSFARRQTADSPFSHWVISEEQLITLIKANWGNQRAGYRDGVILVPVQPEGFFSSVTTLKEGDQLVGEYKARRQGETPRINFYAKGEKMPAKSVEVVLYRNDVLGLDASTNARWEIVSVNASPEVGEAPMQPMTLCANHFGLDGGTPTNMTAEQFETALRESVLYWKDKAMVG